MGACRLNELLENPACTASARRSKPVLLFRVVERLKKYPTLINWQSDWLEAPRAQTLKRWIAHRDVLLKIESQQLELVQESQHESLQSSEA
jgi:hypothetical protein